MNDIFIKLIKYEVIDLKFIINLIELLYSSHRSYMVYSDNAYRTIICFVFIDTTLLEIVPDKMKRTTFGYRRSDLTVPEQCMKHIRKRYGYNHL